MDNSVSRIEQGFGDCVASAPERLSVVAGDSSGSGGQKED